jgi:hypothetical protein
VIVTWQKTFLNNLSTWCLMIAMFANPFGFDIIQYQLLCLTGSLWKANAVLYCIAACFFGLSLFFRRKYKKLP